MLKEKLKVTGRVKIHINGKLVEEIDNLVVTTGKEWIASKFYAAGSPGDDMSHIGIGTGTTAADVSDTALETPIGARAALTSTTVSTNTVEYVATIAAGIGTGAITEAGVFNALTSGTMLCRTTFGVITKGTDDSLTVTWTITIN